MKKVYLIAVVFALLAGFATYMFASQIEKKSTIKDADVTAVVFALQDIPQNTIINDDMITAEAGYFTTKADVLVADATPLPISDPSQILGMITAVDIYAGEQLNEHKFISSEDENVGLSFKLRKNRVAYSFTAGSINGVDGYISPGDTVDILTYETNDKGNVVTKTAYSDLRILRVSDASAQSADAKITSYSTLTVEVTEKQAHELNNIVQGKSYTLVLNSRRGEIPESANADEENAEVAQDAQN